MYLNDFIKEAKRKEKNQCSFLDYLLEMENYIDCYPFTKKEFEKIFSALIPDYILYVENS